LSRPNSKRHSGNKIEIKIELTYAFSNRIPVWEPGRSVLEKFYKENKLPDLISALQYLDIKTYLPEDILVKVDRATMASSLEARVPLLDHRLLEFLARVLVNYKINGKTSKWILREAIKDWLPPKFLDRPKHGFTVPLAYWFRNNLGQFVKDRILGKRFLKRGFFQKNL